TWRRSPASFDFPSPSHTEPRPPCWAVPARSRRSSLTLMRVHGWELAHTSSESRRCRRYVPPFVRTTRSLQFPIPHSDETEREKETPPRSFARSSVFPAMAFPHSERALVWDQTCQHARGRHSGKNESPAS